MMGRFEWWWEDEGCISVFIIIENRFIIFRWIDELFGFDGGRMVDCVFIILFGNCISCILWLLFFRWSSWENGGVWELWINCLLYEFFWIFERMRRMVIVGILRL